MSIFLDLAWINLVTNCSWLTGGGWALGPLSPIHLYELWMPLPWCKFRQSWQTLQCWFLLLLFSVCLTFNVKMPPSSDKTRSLVYMQRKKAIWSVMQHRDRLENAPPWRGRQDGRVSEISEWKFEKHSPAAVQGYPKLAGARILTRSALHTDMGRSPPATPFFFFFGFLSSTLKGNATEHIWIPEQSTALAIMSAGCRTKRPRYRPQGVRLPGVIIPSNTAAKGKKNKNIHILLRCN